MEKLNVPRISGLEHIIKSINYFGSFTIDPDVKTFRFYADGTVGLIYHETDADIFYNGEKGSQLLIYGQTVKTLSVNYSRSISMIVFCFHPYALKYLFGLDANELTDTCLDFDLIDKKLKVSLQEMANTEDRINEICNFLIAAQSRIQKKMDKRIAYATDRIIQESGNVSIAKLRQEIYLTERTFERQFLRSVGVTPSTFSKICRFNSAMEQLNNKKFKSLTDLAYTAGYMDQSHFIHHFKEFTSITPTEYLLLINRQPANAGGDSPTVKTIINK